MGKIDVTPEEVIAAFRADWPLQFEITSLRLMMLKQDQQIAELQKQPEPVEN